jgi:hypothetical protein
MTNTMPITRPMPAKIAMAVSTQAYGLMVKAENIAWTLNQAAMNNARVRPNDFTSTARNGGENSWLKDFIANESIFKVYKYWMTRS